MESDKGALILNPREELSVQGMNIAPRCEKDQPVVQDAAAS